MAGFDHLKRAARDQRKAAVKAAREQRRRQRRCFWTRPYRHEWVKDGDLIVCVSCGKRSA